MNLRRLKLEPNSNINYDINYKPDFNRILRLQEGQFCSGVHTIERISHIKMPDKKMFFNHSYDHTHDYQKTYTLYHVKKYDLKSLLDQVYDLVFVKEANVYTFIYEGQFE